MIGYIYKITNNINGKVYIGQTIQPVKERWYRHCGKSCNAEEMKMHIKKAILKYGKENFSIETLEICDSEDLNNREKHYISYYDSYNNGYNSTLGGQDATIHRKTSIEEDNEIINLYKYGFAMRTIAKEFNIDKKTVKGILVRNNVYIRNTRTYKLSEYDRLNIIEDFNNGISRKDIMKKYGISKSYLSQLITGDRRI